MTFDWRGSRSLAVAAVAALVLLPMAGCSAKKTEDEGLMAAQRAAQADVTAGGAGAPGSAAAIPSLDPDDAHVQMPMAAAPPATAPTGDDFKKDNPAHLLARCRDRSARHEWFDAIGDCRRSAELDPSSIEPHVELMRLLVTLQSYADAEEAAGKVLAARPNDAVALYYLAWSHRGREQYPQAIAALQKAVAADPKRAEFVQALGITYCLSNDYGKGIATLERAAAMQPGDAKTQNALASSRSVLAEKLSPYLRLVKENPESFDNYAALGFMYQKYGLSQRALTAYDTALQKIPAPIESQTAETKKLAAQIYYNRGVVYRDLGRPELAEPALVQATQLDPSLSAFAWYYIGLCRSDAGKYDAGIEALQHSIELAPDVADNRSALADAYDKAGKAQLATEQRNAVAAIAAREAAAKAATAKEDAALSTPSPVAAQPVAAPPPEAAPAEEPADDDGAKP